MSSNSLKVHFDPPTSGWLPVHIETPERELDFLASYIKDSLTDLANALNLICNGVSDHTVVWELEPEKMVFSFRSSENNLLTFSVDEHPNRITSDRLHQKHIELTDSTVNICTIFWRALRRLETSKTPDYLSDHWKFPFPSTTVAQLKKCLSNHNST